MSVYGTPGTAEYQRNWRAANPEKAQQHTATWREKHPERFASALATTDARRRAHLAEFAVKTRDSRKGLAPGQYDLMLAAQHGKCAICGKTEQENGRALCVDHDHTCCPGQQSCGKCIRFLLCTPCNAGIGLFKDDPLLMERAATYVQYGRR